MRAHSLRAQKSYLGNYVIALVAASTMVLPFAWMVLTSFKPRGEVLSFPPTFIPRKPTLENYRNLFDSIDVLRLCWNTGYVSTIKTFIQIYTSALLGYVFGKFSFRFREVIFYSILFTMVLPFEVYVIPLYRLMVRFGLGNTHAALVIPMMFSAYSTFLVRQFMFTIPSELLDAGRIDGASEWYIFHRIVLPLSKPVLATLIGFYFMWNWNDFLWPLIVISEKSKAMLPVALAGLVGEHMTDYGLLMAGASIAMVPTVLVFAVFQRYVVQGIALTGFK